MVEEVYPAPVMVVVSLFEDCMSIFWRVTVMVPVSPGINASGSTFTEVTMTAGPSADDTTAGASSTRDDATNITIVLFALIIPSHPLLSSFISPHCITNNSPDFIRSRNLNDIASTKLLLLTLTRWYEE